MNSPHYLPTFRKTFGEDFGWEVTRALELAIFRTFGVPSISEILDYSGEFAHHGQKRYDDTVALLRETARDGPSSQRGRTSVKRMNRIHGAYDISNDDFIYTLATFIVVPVRWIGAYGWRDLTADEISAAVDYYREVGRLMGIQQIPATFAEFSRFLDAYERRHYSFTEANRRLAVSLIAVLAAWFPSPVRPLVRQCITATFDEPLRIALGLPERAPLVHRGVHAALRSRAVLMRLFPPLRPRRKGPRQLRTYPHGYALSDLGPAWTGLKRPAGSQR